jgi:hypothetical protein
LTPHSTPLIPLSFRKDGDRTDQTPARDAAPVDSDEDKKLLCASCGAAIALQSARIDVNGAHAHRFTNPAGVTYDVVCLSQAACYLDGEPTIEFTWFAGYAWSYAHCGSCHEHLGWYYQGPSKFFGLIADRLVSD